MTPTERAEARALCDRATPGPYRIKEGWRHRGEVQVEENGRMVEDIATFYCGAFEGHGRQNAEFYVAARTLLPRALDRIEELEQRLAGTLPTVKSHEDYATMANNIARIEKERAEAAEARVAELERMLPMGGPPFGICAACKASAALSPAAEPQGKPEGGA